MKGKIALIMLSSVLVLTGGMCVAYYNTKSLGFSDNVKIISSDSEKFTFMDYEFYYKNIDDFMKTARQYLPETPQVTGPKALYNVDVI